MVLFCSAGLTPLRIFHSRVLSREGPSERPSPKLSDSPDIPGRFRFSVGCRPAPKGCVKSETGKQYFCSRSTAKHVTVTWLWIGEMIRGGPNVYVVWQFESPKFHL